MDLRDGAAFRETKPTTSTKRSHSTERSQAAARWHQRNEAGRPDEAELEYQSFWGYSIQASGSVAPKNATNEPTAARENVTNEPTSSPLSVNNCGSRGRRVNDYERTHRGTGKRDERTHGLSVVRCTLTVARLRVLRVGEDERTWNRACRNGGDPNARRHDSRCIAARQALSWMS